MISEVETSDLLDWHQLINILSLSRIYVWGQTPLKFYKAGKQKEKICIC